jgi:hypothetical protein
VPEVIRPLRTPEKVRSSATAGAGDPLGVGAGEDGIAVAPPAQPLATPISKAAATATLRRRRFGVEFTAGSASKVVGMSPI